MSTRFITPESLAFQSKDRTTPEAVTKTPRFEAYLNTVCRSWHSLFCRASIVGGRVGWWLRM